MAPMTLAPTPVTGLRVQAGGDCHLANFGGRGGRGLEERMMRRKLELTCILIALAATAGCGKSQETGYVPGLGELMAGQQVRHAKLWFAGENENWRLAAYEVDELKEGFGDVVKLHPVLEDSHIPVSKLVPTIIEGPLGEVGAAVEARSKPRFE